ncbi:hypothetical protein ABES02_28545 [Neobacillus pocheonensis]|uniref:hypothetical protein n=1 Tax=Neobacillus pocheonensis TaxID=363869 RepID=UPI003D26993B
MLNQLKMPFDEVHYMRIGAIYMTVSVHRTTGYFEGVFEKTPRVGSFIEDQDYNIREIEEVVRVSDKWYHAPKVWVCGYVKRQQPEPNRDPE